MDGNTLVIGDKSVKNIKNVRILLLYCMIILFINGCKTYSRPQTKTEPTNSETAHPTSAASSSPQKISAEEATTIAKSRAYDFIFDLGKEAGGVSVRDLTITSAKNVSHKNGQYYVLLKGYFYGTDDYGTRRKYTFDWTMALDDRYDFGLICESNISVH